MSNNGTAPEKRRACLGMPGYGEQTAGAARGFWLASTNRVALSPGAPLTELEVNRLYQEGSLLAQNFNALWCWPLNLENCGEKVDYFAMQHADIEPQEWWLDILIRELEDRDLDVLGVVAPIKDAQGLTSIALARGDGDPWRPYCRLTMHEIHQLPETFTSEDVGYPLLLNTGLWVCRFNSEWAKKITFTINDRIAYSMEAGHYIAQSEPEDWNFSRQCHELGLKLGCTRKVAIDHCGKMRFTNTQAWGRMKYDRMHVDASILQDDEDFTFPRNVDGWLTYEEGKALVELSEGKEVLEIGSYCGRSTICIAQSAEQVHSVDTHDGRATPESRNTRKQLEQNLVKHELFDKVNILEGTLEECSPLLSEQRFDLIFIDGDHSEGAVKRDIELSIPLLAEGGALAFHDYRTTPGEHDGRWDPGVTEAVNALIANGATLAERRGTIAVVKIEPIAAGVA